MGFQTTDIIMVMVGAIILQPGPRTTSLDLAPIMEEDVHRNTVPLAVNHQVMEKQAIVEMRVDGKVWYHPFDRQ